MDQFCFSRVNAREEPERIRTERPRHLPTTDVAPQRPERCLEPRRCSVNPCRLSERQKPLRWDGKEELVREER